jgi:hypothetical protein
MTGPEQGIVTMWIVIAIGAVFVLYDWWSRRKDRTSSRR